MQKTNTKKYYWLKLFETFFADARIKKLKRLAGGDTYIVILLKLMLQTIKNDGIYVYEGLESTLAKELELKLDEQEEHIQAVLIYLHKTNLIEEVENGHFLLAQVPSMLGHETASAERKRAQRKREKEKQGVTLSHDSHKVSHRDRVREIEYLYTLSPVKIKELYLGKIVDGKQVTDVAVLDQSFDLFFEDGSRKNYRMEKK